MNRVFRVMWNASRQIWMAASELVSSTGRSTSVLFAPARMGWFSLIALALATNLGFDEARAQTLTVDGGANRDTVASESYLSATIGNTGVGTLNIGSGTSMTLTAPTANPVLNVGNFAGSHGVINISNGGKLTISNSLPTRLGNAGFGDLNITSGGRADFYTIMLGYNNALIGPPSPASRGTALVSGIGSLLNARNQITVGNGGASTLTVTNNGAVNAASYMIVGNNSAQGTVTVDNGATLAVGGDMVVGNSGPGLVRLGPGGTIATGTAGVGTLGIGNGAGVTGDVSVSGSGATWRVLGSGAMKVGNSGRGALTISNGGLVDVASATTVYIAQNAGANGTALVTGNGSIWQMTGGLMIGSAGTGALTVADAGKVSASAVTLAANVGGIGKLNIGAAAGSPAAAPGALDASSVSFGSGAGSIDFNHTDTSGSYTFAPLISGNGTVNQLAGTTVLSASNTYTGPTNVLGGTLKAAAAGAFSASSAHTVAAGAVFDAGGLNQTLGSLQNAGIVNLLSSTPGRTLTINGAYVGLGGVLNLSTVLGDSSSVGERLVFNGPGATASGNTTIHVTNLGGLGALTSGNGIEVVSALNGATTTAQTTRNAFALANAHVDAGAFEYRLYAADAQGAGENWYLRSEASPTPEPPQPAPPTPPAPPPTPPARPVPLYRAEVPMFAALPAQQRQADLSMLGNLQRRIGDEGVPATGNSDGQRQAWARAIYTDLDIQQQGVSAPASKGSVSGLQAGTDLLANGNWRAGVYVGYLDGGADVSGSARGVIGRLGSNDLQSRYLGGYATWMDSTGLYADAVLQGGSHRYDVRPDINPSASGKSSSTAASLEVGKPFPLAEGWSIEPQAQIAYQRSKFDNVLISGALISQDAESGWIGRLGVRVKGDIATRAGRLQPYARVNLYHASSGTDVATFIGPAASTPIASTTGYTSTEAAGGMTLTLSPVTTLYGEISHLFSSGGDLRVKSSVQGSLGVRISW